MAEKPLAGLGASLDTLRRVCGARIDVLDALDRVTKRAHGGDRSKASITDLARQPTTGSAANALRKLRKDRPDLHVAVLAGEQTPHGAMVAAGFRPKTITIPVSDPATIARRLRKSVRATGR